MFERFTNRARHVVVLAQEEARRLNHNYIGTEHLLLGLLGEPESVAGRVLIGFGMNLDAARTEVEGVVGLGSSAQSGHIPFTPRAKKILELSLREALQLHHNYIGTEHILLGMIREGEGVAARVLGGYADLLAIRTAVLDLLPTVEAENARILRRWLRRRPPSGQAELGTPVAGEPELNATPAVDTTLSRAAQLAGPQPVGSHHLLLAALTDADTAASRALVALGVDLDRAREVLRSADVTGTSDEAPEEAGRRQMLVRVTDDKLTLEATDGPIVEAGKAALRSLGDRARTPGTIDGDLPAAASLAAVWEALHDSLATIKRLAAAAPPDAPAGPESATGTQG